MNDQNYRENYYAEGLYNSEHYFKILSSDVYFPFSDYNRKTQKQKIKNDAIHDPPYLIRRKSFGLNFYRYFSYKNTIEQFNPDVIHILESAFFIAYLICSNPKYKNIKIIYEQEKRTDNTRKGLKSKISNSLYNIFLKKITERANIVRCTTTEASDYIRQKTNITEKKIKMITLAYNQNNFFYSNEIRNETRKRLNISQDQRIIVTTGRLIKSKRIDLIIKSIPNDSLLILIGEISDTSLLKAKKNVITINKLLNDKELNSFFNAADLAIWTKFSVSYFQALGTGLKILIPKTDYSHYLKSILPKDLLINHFNIRFDEKTYTTKCDDREIIKNISFGIENSLKNEISRRESSMSATVFSDKNIIDELLRQLITNG